MDAEFVLVTIVGALVDAQAERDVLSAEGREVEGEGGVVLRITGIAVLMATACTRGAGESWEMSSIPTGR